MPDTRPINEKKYNISKHRFLELKHHCMQYQEWRRELATLTDTVKAIEYGKEGQGSPPQGSATEQLAIKRVELDQKCKTIEQTAIETDAELYQWILEGVTSDYATYRYLRDVVFTGHGYRRAIEYKYDRVFGSSPHRVTEVRTSCCNRFLVLDDVIGMYSEIFFTKTDPPTPIYPNFRGGAYNG